MIPDLWSDDVKVDVLTPLAILRTQKAYLERRTQGILRAQVATTTTDAWVQHQLELVAPALNQYRTVVLTARHNADLVYPVIVRSLDYLAPPLSPSRAAPGAAEAPERLANSQDEFIALVREILRSGPVRSLIQSLIARSNEVRSEGERGGDGAGGDERNG
jgi:hypothetical protein